MARKIPVDRVPGVNRARVQWCLNEFGITRESLAAALDIPLNFLNDFFEGKEELSVSRLERIAKFFGRGVLFFMDATVPEAGRILSPQFRRVSQENQGMSLKLKKFIERCEEVRRSRLEIAEGLNEDITRFSPPQINNNETIEAITLKCRRWLGVENCRSFDEYRSALESKDILVIRSTGYNSKWKIDEEENVSGFCLFYERLPIIVVRKEESAERQTFTLLHELGHLILHKTSYVDQLSILEDDDNQIEVEANSFASFMLMPTSIINEFNVDDSINDLNQLISLLEPLRRRTGASMLALIYRLARADKISMQYFTEYKARPRAMRENEGAIPRLFRHREPVHTFGRPYVASIIQTYREKEITITKATHFLDDISIVDLQRLEAYVQSS